MVIARQNLWKNHRDRNRAASTGRWHWNRVGKATFGCPRMDDKTLNLWRQIEDGRRRGVKRTLRVKTVLKTAINDN